MRTITIDFTASQVVSSYDLGKRGEHNATKLTFTPPAELSGESRTDHYRVAFNTGGTAVLSEEYLTVPFSIVLGSQLTKHSRLSLQVIAYDADGGYVGKSDKLSSFYFEGSVDGTAVEIDGENADIAYEVKQNTEARHTHSNKDLLDTLAKNDDGDLLVGSTVYYSASETDTAIDSAVAAAENYVKGYHDSAKQNVIDADNKLSADLVSGLPKTLPNPNTLKITVDGTETDYDGSKENSITLNSYASTETVYTYDADWVSAAIGSGMVGGASGTAILLCFDATAEGQALHNKKVISVEVLGEDDNYKDALFIASSDQTSGSVVSDPSTVETDGKIYTPIFVCGGTSFTLESATSIKVHCIEKFAIADAPTVDTVQSMIDAKAHPISYSTEEQDTGLTWIDGKKIYQKTYEVDYPTKSTWQNASFGTSVNEIIKQEFLYKYGNDLKNAPVYDGFNKIEAGSNLETGFWFKVTGNDFSAGKFIITIQYTKTEA